jgi:hypothetical protein
MLALAEVQHRHHGRLFVLRGVALEDLGDDGLVFGRELEGDIGVVLGSISVLDSQQGKRVSFPCLFIQRATTYVWKRQEGLPPLNWA